MYFSPDVLVFLHLIERTQLLDLGFGDYAKEICNIMSTKRRPIPTHLGKTEGHGFFVVESPGKLE
jgi:hypothetical protein